ncbi:hypothetical protein MATR_30300 [Marivirga tractuosa]|uniref:FG-GAP repeat protein n=1 Tax=Marivirga tractuosa (strain ATCC 23168 / DSM 4126 / NBRC 15989 / NCIMB 1408 / VKM B-1430 / H-43) TaxID=643867 RepID=E4TUM8_MARTH|nr:gliding motility-associated C-terminal domain-containing protein [Marivirga tractuosa]ADR23121.1 FG-GAP repeat protein [Marivirga tractuosa DSM 4126]BDD16205.1 hypothetical protein MATR_30300 [Marivirga tractuosa]
MKQILLLFIFSLASLSLSIAQEICDDGIDNDGDGFVDCFDGDCTDTAACDGFYLGNDASCEAEPEEFPVFELELGPTSRDDVTTALSRIAIGDLDRDGIPEILTTNRYDDKIFLLNGDSATVKHERTTNNPYYNNAAMVNLQDDNCGEVFVVNVNSGNNYNIRSFDCELNPIWASERLYQDPVFLSFADFDGDGQAEMYYKDEIRDPINGTRIVETTTANWKNIPGGPVAVDIVGDSDLELVIGNRIYGVNLGDRTEDAGSLTLLATMPAPYQTKSGGQQPQNSTTSIADFNLDGNLDVIVSGANSSNVTTVFFWDVFNNTVKTFSDPFAEAGYEFGWRQGTGRVNIADLDGDGQLNAAFVSGKYLYALDENWNLFWKTLVNEETSGITGCTLFDFNGDGQSEVVYRDEDYLYILNGKDGTINPPKHCRSRTSVEYPIVADVDADGSTEICVVCVTEDHRVGTPGRNLSLDAPAEVRIYKSGAEPWVPARRVWNQHAYFNVNINDDLTVPRIQQKHQAVFSTGICTTGPSRPLNSFLNQSPFLSSDGCPTFASPDLNIIETSFSITPPNCPDKDFTVSFEYENIGDVPLTGNVPITFYDGDPLVAGTNKLNTVFITLNNFTVGDVGNAANLTINGTGGQFTLYAVLNDNGTSTPAPISLPNSNFLECDYVNNIISAEVNPEPFILSTETTNNITCAAGTVPPNGSARVFRLVGGSEITADYDFFWFNGTTVDDTPDYTGSIYTGLAAGTYTVYAADKLAGCSSDTVQVVISDSVRTINADITVDRGNDDCDNPNGKLTVAVNGGEPVGNFTYEWYVGNSVGGGLEISNSHVANNLESGAYTVLVMEKATGCQTITSIEVPDNRDIPIVNATATDIVCSQTNSGSVSATVGGATAGFTFDWFIGNSVKPTADFTGSTVNNLPQGTYTVVATNNTSSCESTPVPVTVNQTVNPEIDAVSATSNTSCDASLPNGSVSVTIVGSPADHTIVWFAGAGTTGTQVGSGLTVNDLSAGEYTVRVTEDATGCSVTDRITINNNIIQPVASATADPVTTCSPLNGRVEASVDLDNIADYTFFWYKGDQVKSSTDFDVTGNIIENLEPGFYTMQAFHNTRNCLTDAVTIEVIDQATVTIEQEENVLSIPTACDQDNGVLEVEVNSPNNVSGFLIEWYEGTTITGSPFQSDNGVTVATASNLFTGLYTVVATDLDNECSNQKVFNLPFIGAHQLDSISYQNATTCVPFDGSIEVEVTPSGTTTLSDYQLYLFRENNGDYIAVDTLAGTDPPIFSNLGQGTYIVEAFSDFSGCSVYLLDIEIELEVSDPVITDAVTQPNTNCDITSANGSIEISIDNQASPSLYTFNWYEGTDTSTPLGTTIGSTAGVNGERADSLIGGSYTVEVFNDSTQCSTLRTFSINDNPVIVSIPNAEIDITAITRCDTTNSEVTINNVFENGVAADINDFTFEWYNANMDILPNAGSPNTSDSIVGLPEGTYFVRARNIDSECETALIEFSIETDIVEPTISLEFKNPERCALQSPGDEFGFLRVNASAPNTTFSYNWYDGPDTTSAVAHTGPEYLNLSADVYTVAIRDSISNCVYVETYELVTEINSLNISASATPLTNCDSPNGSVFATVTSGGSYSYLWTNVNGNTVGTSKEVNNLPVGEYTVVATDNTDTFCEVTATVTIENGQINPPLTLEQVAPLTVCDERLANGAAKARVDGGFVGYTFEWYEGASASGTIIHLGPDFSGMRDVSYTVRAINDLTQCFSDETITISEEIPAVEDPAIEVVSNDTNCQIDNGELRVDVNGNTGNFLFEWYRGTNTNGSLFGTGDRIIDLGEGEYTVIATDLRTGCLSDPITASISEDLVYPEFTYETVSSICGENNGSAVVFLDDLAEEVTRIEWYDSFGTRVAIGPNLDGVAAGVYTVIIETRNDCVVEEDITILSDIQAFNGISRNGDASNSFFKIACIGQYPNNIVKIYNRAGTLVYEAIGYDNNNVKFDGISNRGINVMGESLPDGTYFYVIDKNDGSKPKNGYLEIVK